MDFLNEPEYEVDYAQDKQELIELVLEVGFRVPAWLDRSRSWVNATNDSKWDKFCSQLWEEIREGEFEAQVAFENFDGHTKVEYILEGDDWKLKSYWNGQEVNHFTLTAVEDYHKVI